IEPVTEFVPSTENEVQFIVVVTNSGPSDVIEAVVASELGAGLVDIDWTCEAGPGGSCVDEAGTDDVAGLVDLETGGSATYLITSVLADPDSDQDITSSAIIVEPENVSDPDINNNEDEAAIRTGVFADGFESPPIP
ncbi:MAG: hypothetical protein R6V61_12310, partial [Wenzhouxiangellaceae bacterium]